LDEPAEITRDVLEAAFRAVDGERERAWSSRSEEAKDAYVQRLRRGAREPVELSALLVDRELAQRWEGVHWLLRAEFCAWINAGRTGFTRRRRAAFALKQAPTETL
jgi:hypothetical protein